MSAGLCIHSSEILAQPSLMPRYRSPASAGAESFFLYRVRACVPVDEQLEYTFSKSSLDFRQMGHTVVEVEGFAEFGAPM